MMSRSARLGLVLVAALVIAGCTQSEPAAPQTGAPAPTPEAVAPTPEVPAPEANMVPSQPDTPQPPEQPKTDNQDTPTPISAIGKAISGALGIQKDEVPSEAPAYKPPAQ